MLWISLALFSALVIASRRVYEKNLTASFGNYSMGLIVQGFSLLPTLALFAFFPLPADPGNLPWEFWWPLIIIWLILYPVQTYFMYRAVREGEVAAVTPIVALIPVFNAVASLVLIGEKPALSGLAGILAIVAGTYLLLTEAGETPGKKYNRAVIFMIIATVCVGIGTTLDKIAVTASTPVFYSFINSLGATVVFLILMTVFRQNHELKKIPPLVLPLTVLGIFQALSYTATMMAFALGPTAYVLAIRSSSFLFAAFFAMLFLKEKLSRKKLVAFAFVLTGIVLITLET